MAESMETDDMEVMTSSSEIADNTHSIPILLNPDVSELEQTQQGSEMGMERTMEDVATMHYTSPYARQISKVEYNRQADLYTQEALRLLKASPEYKKFSMKCQSCGSDWYSGQHSTQCPECDGYAMHRSCPLCHGYCGKMWQRDVDMSHSTGHAHWNGCCGHQQAARLLKDLIVMDNITEAMGGLNTSSEPTIRKD